MSRNEHLRHLSSFNTPKEGQFRLYQEENHEMVLMSDGRIGKIIGEKNNGFMWVIELEDGRKVWGKKPREEREDI